MDVSPHSSVLAFTSALQSFPLDHLVNSFKLQNVEGSILRKSSLCSARGGCSITVCWKNECTKQTFLVRMTLANSPSYSTSPLFLGFCLELISSLWVHDLSTLSSACDCPQGSSSAFLICHFLDTHYIFLKIRAIFVRLRSSLSPKAVFSKTISIGF